MRRFISATYFSTFVIKRTAMQQFIPAYLNDIPLHQPIDGDIIQAKRDQCDWLLNEQWLGYSKTYLNGAFSPNRFAEDYHADTRDATIGRMLAMIFKFYNPAATILSRLERDPLNPSFHKELQRAKNTTEELAKEIDKVYADLHPTYKLMYDTHAVGRYFILKDWAVAAAKQRQRVVDEISPDVLDAIEKMQFVAEEHKKRMIVIRDAIKANPTLALPPEAVEGLTEEELQIMSQRLRYYSKRKAFGEHWHHFEFHH